MTSRRQLLFAGVLLVLSPATAFGQGTVKLPVIVYVFASYKTADMTGPNPVGPHARAFVHRLRDLGWEDGRNFVLERHGVQDNRERAQAIYADAAARKVDLIVAVGSTGGTVTAVDAVRATRTTPIVFAGGSGESAVALGLVASLARPGGNVTGLTVGVGPAFGAKRLELMKEIAPRIKRVAYLNPKSPGDDFMRGAATRLGMTLVLAHVESRDQYEQALDFAAREKVDAILTGASSMHHAAVGRIAAFAAERKLLTASFIPDLPEAGGLMSYGIDFLDLNRRAAEYVDKILRGAKPADLPVEQPRKFELVLNLKTARELGITIPQSILLRADKVIE
jgi:putative tryptophan/tyrosine transport system substrate-binding protein